MGLRAVSQFQEAALGTVTSVDLALPPTVFTITGTHPVTTSGTLTGSLIPQVGNLVWAGPANGSTAVPTFRALTNADTTGISTLLALTTFGTVTSGQLLVTDVRSSKTATFTVTAATTTTQYDNAGASGTVNFVLPTAASGLRYGFAVAAAQEIGVVAGASTTIYIGSAVSAAAGTVVSSTVGSYLEIEGISSTVWMAKSSTGSWSGVS